MKLPVSNTVLANLLCMLQVHGVFMAVSFVALLPISVIFAATRDRLWGPRIWFQTHRALNVSTSCSCSLPADQATQQMTTVPAVCTSSGSTLHI